MPKPTKLSLWAYVLGANSGRRDYAPQIKALEFTTIAPGGFGDLTAKLLVKNSRTIPPELRLFANVALKSGVFTAFLGRWDEPGILLDSSAGDGELYQLHAMGAASCLQDDPADAAYTNHTAQYIIGHELSSRNIYLPLDQDTSQILPDNPTDTFSPAFNGKTLEEELNELSPLLGDYQWGVWDHAQHRDAAGFPTWQLYWHIRGTTTPNSTGYFADESKVDVRPAVEYSFNVVQIKYRDATTDLPSSVTVSDSRLGAGGAQGSAPFPRRKLVKDLSSDHLSGTEATALANALLTQYENGGFKIQITLDRAHDANGQEIPLWQVRADTNIALPQFAPIANTLPLTWVPNTNLFYITETHYSESEGQSPQLDITCDSFYDTSAFQIARMQYKHQQQVSNTKIHHVVRAAGEQETGQASVGWPSIATAGNVFGSGVNFKTACTNTPTSITLTLINQTNCSGVSAAAITNVGFEFDATVNANGAGNARYTYTTVGA